MILLEDLKATKHMKNREVTLIWQRDHPCNVRVEGLETERKMARDV